MVKKFLKDFETELAARINGLTRPDPGAWKLWDEMLEDFSPARRTELVRTYEYAFSIPYEHEGLSPEIYFAHVLRVAAFAGLVSGSGDAMAVKIGLLHNALEVGHVSQEELSQNSSEEIACAVALLTVDRSRQWDLQYKKEYYSRLSRASVSVRTVKVMDKLDNIFLLHSNSDMETKTKYREELQSYVVPLALTVDHGVHQYMQQLIDFSLRQERE
jgi:(p)ppGpp synthase/HD superfamily hydrolase